MNLYSVWDRRETRVFIVASDGGAQGALDVINRHGPDLNWTFAVTHTRKILGGVDAPPGIVAAYPLNSAFHVKPRRDRSEKSAKRRREKARHRREQSDAS